MTYIPRVAQQIEAQPAVGAGAGNTNCGKSRAAHTSSTCLSGRGFASSRRLGFAIAVIVLTARSIPREGGSDNCLSRIFHLVDYSTEAGNTEILKHAHRGSDPRHALQQALPQGW